MTPTPIYIEPDWPAPENVVALSTTRLGGYSEAPYNEFNLAQHVGDLPDAVASNRALLAARLPGSARLCWLDQVHGSDVVKANDMNAATIVSADASWSDRPGVVCAIMTADCLPVLLCAVDGSCVAAAHAGWRGLQAGVLEATVTATGADAGRLIAWLGPAIGPARFEVGPEVREAFLAVADTGERDAVAAAFSPSDGRAGHYRADLYALARQRLASAGVAAVYGGEYCTFEERTRFFSYRRDHTTGRMATVIALTAQLEKRRFDPI
jgi:YfiH family protein